MPTPLARPHLIRRAQQALESGCVFLEAPAGYGKTMLLRRLCQDRPSTYLMALHQADVDLAGLRARLAPLLQPGHTLLLDDVHLLEGGPEACAWLASQLAAPGLCFVLAGRSVPPELAAAAESAGAASLREDFLAFAPEETAALLASGAALDSLTPQAVHDRLAGWPLGIGLVAGLPPGAGGLPQVQEHLFTYLAQRVFAGLPASLRRFLTLSAVPLRFNGVPFTFLAGGQ